MNHTHQESLPVLLPPDQADRTRREAGLTFLAAGAVLLAGCTTAGSTPQPRHTPAPVPPPETGAPPRVDHAPQMGFALSLDTLRDLSPSGVNLRLGLARELGATVVRVDFDADTSQTDRPGVFDWAQSDRVMTAAKLHGLNLIALLTGTPSHASAAFAGAAAERYTPHGLVCYEVGNEPNIAEMGADPRGYAGRFNASQARIKAYNPQALVAIGGLAPSNTDRRVMSPADFLAATLRAGLRDPDAVGLHPYDWPGLPDDSGEDWNVFTQIENAGSLSPGQRTIAEVLRRAGHRYQKVPVWFTEFGAPTGGSGRQITATNRDQFVNGYTDSDNDYVHPDLQAASLRQMLTHEFREVQVPIRLVYTLEDMRRPLPGQPSNESHFGVLNIDGTDKPSAKVFRAAAAHLRRTGRWN